jgi:hypothetical protein
MLVLDLTRMPSLITVSHSSDLWIDLPVPNSQDLGVSAEIRYAIGAVQGSLHQAELDFAGYTVPNQTYCRFSLMCFPSCANYVSSASQTNGCEHWEQSALPGRPW